MTKRGNCEIKKMEHDSAGDGPKLGEKLIEKFKKTWRRNKKDGRSPKGLVKLDETSKKG